MRRAVSSGVAMLAWGNEKRAKEALSDESVVVAAALVVLKML